MTDSIFDRMADSFVHGKDRALAELAKFLANRFALSRYGEMSNFSIDSLQKEIRLELRLKGEAAPLAVRAIYHLERSGGERFLVFDRVSTSREWANLLLADLIRDQPLRMELPSKVALAVRIMGL